jgi:uncharacterized membrane protein YfcA
MNHPILEAMNPTIVAAGLLVGLLYGLFGVGSAFATPLLAVLGVSGLAAVAAPLPGLLPGSATGAWSHRRHGHVDWIVARRAMIGATPAAIVGSVAAHWIGGPALLLVSGAVLLGVGVRVVWPTSSTAANIERAAARRASRRFVIGVAAAVGFASGLLANGGGFLLVPFFLLILGLDMREAAGTSLTVAFVATMPTLVTHAALGDIDWRLAAVFALGLVPGVLAGSQLSRRLPTERLTFGFGIVMVGFAGWFLAHQVGVMHLVG